MSQSAGFFQQFMKRIGPPAYRALSPIRPGHALGALLAFFVIAWLFQAIAVYGLGFARYLLFESSYKPDDPLVSETELWIIFIFAQILLLILVLNKLSWQMPLMERALSLFRMQLTLAQSIMLTCSILALICGLSSAIHHFFPTGSANPFREELNSDAWLAVFFVYAICWPIVGEVCFRGFLLSALTSHGYSFLRSAIIVTSLWTLLGWDYAWQDVITSLVIGMTLCGVLWRFGSLWLCISLHALLNCSIMAAVKWYT